MSRPMDHGSHDQGQEHSKPVLTPGFGGDFYILDYDMRALRFLLTPYTQWHIQWKKSSLSDPMYHRGGAQRNT